VSISDEKMLEIIAIFEKEIRAYEDTMFGLMLYHETAPKWVNTLQKISYKNMKRRGEKALKEARNILSDAKQGKPAKYAMPFFEFPIILDDMKSRIDVLLQCYEELYPERPRDRSLSKEEMIALRNEAMNKI
jgi:hypothetical protein